VNGDLAARIDHATLDPKATARQIVEDARACARLRVRGFCVAPRHVSVAVDALGDADVILVSVAGFPAASSRDDIVLREIAAAVQDGAAEIDWVLPLGPVLEGRFVEARACARAVVAEASGRPVKGIVESAFLDDDDVDRVVEEVLIPAGVAFLKTGTGVYGPGVALPPPRVARFAARLAGRARLKVSGAIRDAQTARSILAAGADLLGTSRTFALVDGG
jgi:deoxyribose-phosphate aldolase